MVALLAVSLPTDKIALTLNLSGWFMVDPTANFSDFLVYLFFFLAWLLNGFRTAQSVERTRVIGDSPLGRNTESEYWALLCGPKRS